MAEIEPTLNVIVGIYSEQNSYGKRDGKGRYGEDRRKRMRRGKDKEGKGMRDRKE